MKRWALPALMVAAALAGQPSAQAEERSEPGRAASRRTDYDQLIATHAKANLVPESLVHRVIVRESRYNPDLVGRGGTIGLMQLKLATARGVGFHGDASALHDPETNLAYGIKYLAGAWRAALGDADRAMHYYAVGYYYVAKQQRLERLKHAASAPKDNTKPPEAIAKSAENADETTADAKPATRPKAASRRKSEAKAEVPRPPSAVSDGANAAKPR